MGTCIYSTAIFYSLFICSLGGPPLRTLSNLRSVALTGWHLNHSLRLLVIRVCPVDLPGTVLWITQHREGVSISIYAVNEGTDKTRPLWIFCR